MQQGQLHPLYTFRKLLRYLCEEMKLQPFSPEEYVFIQMVYMHTHASTHKDMSYVYTRASAITCNEILHTSVLLLPTEQTDTRKWR